MSNKPGSSSYQKGDCGGSHGDYEHGMQMGKSGFGLTHGFGPKMQAMHEGALKTAKSKRINKHMKRLQRAGGYRSATADAWSAASKELKTRKRAAAGSRMK